MDNIRKLAQNLIKECEDIRTAYATVCNNLNPSNPNKEMLAVKHYLEYLLACESMEEYNWERDEFGRWFRLKDDEFWSHLKARLTTEKE